MFVIARGSHRAAAVKYVKQERDSKHPTGTSVKLEMSRMEKLMNVVLVNPTPGIVDTGAHMSFNASHFNVFADSLHVAQ